LELDLASIPSRTFGQGRQCREAAIEMANGFEMRQALGSMLAGLQSLINRALGITGRSQVMG
jgi:hypothetical protein